jgi:hypothetical protein
MSTMASPIPWDKADKGQVHQVVIQHVQRIEREQSDLYDRFVKLARLYDPNSDRDNVVVRQARQRHRERLRVERRHRVRGDRGDRRPLALHDRRRDWAMQRMARHLEWYARRCPLTSTSRRSAARRSNRPPSRAPRVIWSCRQV